MEIVNLNQFVSVKKNDTEKIRCFKHYLEKPFNSKCRNMINHVYVCVVCVLYAFALKRLRAINFIYSCLFDILHLFQPGLFKVFNISILKIITR